MSATTLTAATPAPEVHTPSAPARAWRIVRLHTANWMNVLGWPLAILMLIFVVSRLLLSPVKLTDDVSASDGVQVTGASLFIFIYLLVVAVQAINASLPLALGYGTTRRAFSVGSMMTFTLLSLVDASVMTLGSWVEELTDGWGINYAFFNSFITRVDNWPTQWWVFFCWFMFFCFAGMIFAVIFARWRTLGLTLSLVTLGVLFLTASVVLTLTELWIPFWEQVGGLGVAGVANVAVGVSVACALITHFLLRRVTPRG